MSKVSSSRAQLCVWKDLDREMSKVSSSRAQLCVWKYTTLPRGTLKKCVKVHSLRKGVWEILFVCDYSGPPYNIPLSLPINELYHESIGLDFYANTPRMFNIRVKTRPHIHNLLVSLLVWHRHIVYLYLLNLYLALHWTILWFFMREGGGGVRSWNMTCQTLFTLGLK